MRERWRARTAPFRSLPRNVRLYVLAEALSAFATGAFGAVYNLYVLSLGADTALLGTLLVVASGGAGAAVLPAGAIVDRLGPRTLLLGGSVVVAVGIGMQLIMPTVPVLVVGNVLAGAGAATFYVAAAPFLAQATPPERQNDVFSLDTAAALGAAAAGSAFAGQVAALLGAGTDGSATAYRLALLLGGAVGVLSFPVLLLTDVPGTATLPDTAGAAGNRRGSEHGELPAALASGRHRRRWQPPTLPGARSFRPASCSAWR